MNDFKKWWKRAAFVLWLLNQIRIVVNEILVIFFPDDEGEAPDE